MAGRLWSVERIVESRGAATHCGDRSGWDEYEHNVWSGQADDIAARSRFAGASRSLPAYRSRKSVAVAAAGTDRAAHETRKQHGVSRAGRRFPNQLSERDSGPQRVRRVHGSAADGILQTGSGRTLRVVAALG